jgi:glycosyltransferase involved in cell wall biosynthesis
MRILFLGEAQSPHLGRWQGAFKDFGWDVLTASVDFDEQFAGQRLTSRSERGPLRYISLVDQVKNLVSEFQPHLVNAHFLPTYGLAAALANAHPLVVTLWGSDILLSGAKGLFRGLRSKFVLKRADLVVGDSDYLLEEAGKIVSLRRRLVVSFGVLKSWYESGLARSLKELSTVTIFSCRRMEKLYDLPTLLRAAKVLATERFPFTLLLAGTGGEESNLRSLSRELNLEEKVIFLGRLSEEKLFTTYRNSDIYVSTSLSDSTSVSLLEAMSQKLYPVVTNIPGNREWLDDSRFLFEPGNSNELAARIKLGFECVAREKAYESYQPLLKQRGIREEQMKVAEMTFLKLIDEIHRR